jgi:hypothetical protein
MELGLCFLHDVKMDTLWRVFPIFSDTPNTPYRWLCLSLPNASRITGSTRFSFPIPIQDHDKHMLGEQLSTYCPAEHGRHVRFADLDLRPMECPFIWAAGGNSPRDHSSCTYLLIGDSARSRYECGVRQRQISDICPSVENVRDMGPGVLENTGRSAL